MLDALWQLDGGFLLLLQNARVEWLNGLVAAFSSLGNGGILWIALALAMLLWKPTRKAGALGLAALLVGALITNVTVKPLVARPRPWLDVAGLIPLVDEHDPHSFPSGHTCAAFAAGVIWWKTLPKRWMSVFMMAVAVAMGLSRLYVGVHYPSDVLCGALVGTFSALIVWKGDQLRQRKKQTLS